jgi:alkaline phosphatase D
MDISKRDLIGGAVAAAIVPALDREAGAQSATGKPRVMEGPMIGAARPDGVTIWARVSGAHAVQVAVGDDPFLGNARATAAVAAREADDFTVRIPVAGLAPGRRYFYRVLVDGRPDDYLDDGPALSFVTAPPGKARFRVAYGSCARYQADRRQRIWDAVRDANPDQFFWLGDNVYVDALNPSAFAEEYRRQRSVASLQPLLRSVPQLAIWDDHDYGLNNHDRTSPMKDAGFAAFKQYWANPSHGLDAAPGVFFPYTYGGVDFFFLDVRTYRDPNEAPATPDKTMLGAAQLAWLKDQIAASRAPFKVLVSGSGWSAGKGPTGDAWSAFTSERNALFDFIRDRRIEGVILLSGDTHVGELNCIPWSDKGGYDFYDLVSSPLAQRPEISWEDRTPEIRIRQVFYNDCNFGLLDFDLTGAPKLTFNIHDGLGAPVWAPFEIAAAELRNGVVSWRDKIDAVSLDRHQRWKAGGAYYP